MYRQLCYFFLILFITSPATAQMGLGDSLHSKGSGIDAIKLDQEKEMQLTRLGMLWGFIKYYHSGVAKGYFNMDDELFQVLPKVLAAKTSVDANTVMEKWIDHFSKPVACDECKEIKIAADTKLLPDYGYLFDRAHFSPAIIAKLQYIKKNRNATLKHFYVEMAERIGNPVFTNENPYPGNNYPDAGIRLLALYRYWNMIEYFYPNRHLIGDNWNKVLTESIPDFVNAKDSAEYTLACLKLIANIHDTHANINGGRIINELRGMYLMPFDAEFVEDKLVITSVNKILPTTDLKVGDIIEQINGIPVPDLIKKYAPLTPASNYETQLRELSGKNSFMMRSSAKEAELTIARDDKTTKVKVSLLSAMDKRTKIATQEKKEAYKIIDDHIGYIYPAMLKDGDVDNIKSAFSSTKGLIIDMRCYPSTFMPFTYGEWLKPDSSAFVKFTFGSVDAPGMFTYSTPLKNGIFNPDPYKGKVVIIVNEKTQSAAEYATMALATAPHVTVIGSTTAGADGNVSEIILPSGIRTMISGIGILYPDGTETQRKGVKVDIVVKPTIKGIKAGKDELLDKAIDIINHS